jgi:hypothetical protein
VSTVDERNVYSINRGKLQVLGEKPVPMPLFPPKTHKKIQFHYPYAVNESNTLHCQKLTEEFQTFHSTLTGVVQM